MSRAFLFTRPNLPVLRPFDNAGPCRSLSFCLSVRRNNAKAEAEWHMCLLCLCVAFIKRPFIAVDRLLMSKCSQLSAETCLPDADGHTTKLAVTCGFLALAAVDVGKVVAAALRLAHAAASGQVTSREHAGRVGRSHILLPVPFPGLLFPILWMDPQPQQSSMSHKKKQKS